MADAAVEFLLENIKQLLLYNSNLIIDLKDQVEYLYNDLSLFKAFLRDSTEKRYKNEVLKELVRQIRSVVCEAEDAIDTFVTQAAVHKARGHFEKAFHIFDYPAKLRSVAREIEGIRGRVKGIYDNKRFGFEPLQDGLNGEKKRKAPVVEEDDVVGFEDEAETLMNLLIKGPEELDIISIVGMPGLGKSTLARKIFRDPKIEYEFYNRAWVYVSQDYNRKEVFLSILSSLTQPTENMYRMDDENLAKALHKILEEGKYFIVMDDVWSREAWDDLKIAFPKNNKHSRILITSRIRNVATYANRNRAPHDLRFLTFEESWELLQKKVFGKEECPSELEELGMQIARKCDGLPLAIVVIAGILLDKGTITYWWEKVAESVNTYIAMDQEKCMDILALSYNHLPYHLKSCFLYFGMFPEDFDIPVWKLIRLWIAEGFIQQKEGLRLEDIAEEYLEDLINRNLVMVGKRRSNGKIKTCNVHDMLHDFCKKEAAEENFYQEIKRFDQLTFLTSNPNLEKYRRLCIHSRVLSYIASKPIGPRVRSFLCFSFEEITLLPMYISSIPGAFKLLRVLDIRSITFSRFPNELTQLVHLRYIALSSNFKVIPAAISKLWNMQTLIIDTSSRNLELKADIWKMIQLRHVNTNASTTFPGPLSKTRSKEDPLVSGNLQTLCTVSPQSCTEDVFARAPNLKKLSIRGKLAILMDAKGSGGTSSFDSLGKLEHLETLKLLNDVFPNPPSEGKLHSLPFAYKFPPKLKKLTLSDTLLDWKHMSILGMLDNLEVLKLKDNAFQGEWWMPADGGFRRLKVLHIGRTDIVSWKASAHHFPRLRSLVLRHCSKLDSVPCGLADVLSLQFMELYCTTKSAAASARKIEEAKKDMQGKKSSNGIGFKLSIYPPDHY